MNSNVCFNARIVNNVSSCISPRISDQRFAMHSDSLHTDNNWNNWFHFQYDRLWPVNMTGKTKSWLVNSPISPDIVRWPAVISSPEINQSVVKWIEPNCGRKIITFYLSYPLVCLFVCLFFHYSLSYPILLLLFFSPSTFSGTRTVPYRQSLLSLYVSTGTTDRRYVCVHVCSLNLTPP